MAEKRDPVTHRTPSQTREHRREYQQTPEQREINRRRKALRYKAEKAGLVKRNDGKDVSHKKAIVNGGGDSLKNVTVQPAAKNRGHGMTDGKKPNKGR